MPKFSNELINEKSLYLLKHAHNPVKWQSWDEETLKKAKKKNKIIILSIGYSVIGVMSWRENLFKIKTLLNL